MPLIAFLYEHFADDFQHEGRVLRHLDPNLATYKQELKPGIKPWASYSPKYSPKEKEFLATEIPKFKHMQMLMAGSSPFASPILVAWHPRTGRPRLVFDKRKVNELTERDCF